MKYLVLSSSGMTRKIALFSVQNFSASMAVSKHRICSNSESRNAFSLDSAVERTLCMACSALLRAAPANHLVLCSSGKCDSSSWKRVRPLTPLGASRSCISLNTDTICLCFCSQYSAISKLRRSAALLRRHKKAFCPAEAVSKPPELILQLLAKFMLS